MNKKELAKILKPLIKECIKEVIFEEGTLSTIVSEVMKGTSTGMIAENKQAHSVPSRLESSQEAAKRRNEMLKQQKKQMLDAIGRDAYNGVDLFEGTTPITGRKENSMSPQGSKALDGVAPNDPGVDISGFGLPQGVWKKLAGN